METSTKTATKERIKLGGRPGERTSMFLWRRDLDLLRALYRGQPGGYALHIRAAVHSMCKHIRRELAHSEHGQELLRKLGQENLK